MGMCSCGCRSTLSDTCSHIWGQTLKRRPKDKSCRSRLARKEHRLSHGHTISRRCINGVALIEHVEDDQSDVVPLFELPSDRSEEHTSELQSLMRISYAVFCLK